MGPIRQISRAVLRFRLRQSGAALVTPVAAFATSLAMSLSVFGDSKPATIRFADTFGPEIETVALPAPASHPLFAEKR